MEDVIVCEAMYLNEDPLPKATYIFGNGRIEAAYTESTTTSVSTVLIKNVHASFLVIASTK